MTNAALKKVPCLQYWKNLNQIHQLKNSTVIVYVDFDVEEYL